MPRCFSTEQLDLIIVFQVYELPAHHLLLHATQLWCFTEKKADCQHYFCCCMHLLCCASSKTCTRPSTAQQATNNLIVLIWRDDDECCAWRGSVSKCVNLYQVLCFFAVVVVCKLVCNSHFVVVFLRQDYMWGLMIMMWPGRWFLPTLARLRLLVLAKPVCFSEMLCICCDETYQRALHCKVFITTCCCWLFLGSRLQWSSGKARHT